MAIPAELAFTAADPVKATTTTRAHTPRPPCPPADGSASTRTLPRRRLGVSSHEPGWATSQRTFDTWPLRATDPRTINGYRLLSRLGSGGTADVFYAVTPAGQPAAIKIFRSIDRSVDVCRREFRLTYAVDPHCTAPVLGYGVSAAGAYIATAYLPGYRCGSTLMNGTMPVHRLWRLGWALASILAAVHACGVIHCDVKPSNLLVRGDDVRLIDFGIARYIGHRHRADGIIECSRGWAAPEQLTTASLTPAADIFAWGCLIAYLASGVHPFASTSTQEWMLRVRSAEPDLYGLPPAMKAVVAQTLARGPRDRPSAPELAAMCHARVGLSSQSRCQTGATLFC